ncbi:hypothetical protein [Streptomyces sennicomposti]
MSDVFEIGQKVKHASRGDVEVTYGPYDSPYGTRYLVRLETGKETHASAVTLSAIPETPKFAVGDKAKGAYSGTVYTIVAGPFDDNGHVWYVTREPNGAVGHNSAADLEVVEPAPIKVGDRVRVVKDGPDERTGEFVGKVGKLIRDDGFSTSYLVEFGDGSGRHGDPENGRWWVAEVERVTDESADTYEHAGVTYDDTIEYAVREYGPLTRVND